MLGARNLWRSALFVEQKLLYWYCLERNNFSLTFLPNMSYLGRLYMRPSISTWRFVVLFVGLSVSWSFCHLVCCSVWNGIFNLDKTCSSAQFEDRNYQLDVPRLKELAPHLSLSAVTTTKVTNCNNNRKKEKKKRKKKNSRKSVRRSAVPVA